MSEEIRNKRAWFCIRWEEEGKGRYVITPESMLGHKHIRGKDMSSVLDVFCLSCAFDIYMETSNRPLHIWSSRE